MQIPVFRRGAVSRRRFRDDVSGVQYAVRQPGAERPARNRYFDLSARRGTSVSGAGLLLGGYIAQIGSFDKAYLFGACLTVVSALYFKLRVAPHFEKNKLR